MLFVEWALIDRNPMEDDVQEIVGFSKLLFQPNGEQILISIYGEEWMSTTILFP